MMVTKPRVTRCRQYSQKGVITRHSITWHKTMWLLGKTEWLLATLTSMEECGQTKITKARGPKRFPKSGTRSIKRAFNHVKATWWVVLAYLDCLKVFENYIDASSNQLGAVMTQDNCQTSSLRPLIWNLLLCTVVQCYITISTGAKYRKGQSISWQVQASLVGSLKLCSTTTVSPTWTTSHSWNLKFKGILRGQPTSVYWPQTKISHEMF